MNLKFNKELTKGYVSNTQIARILTEGWVRNNIYCPSCGNNNLNSFENNNPVGTSFVSLKIGIRVKKAKEIPSH